MQQSISLRHFGIVTKDINAMERFYIDIFGLRSRGIVNEFGTCVETVLRHKNLRVKTCKLYDSHEKVALELLHFEEPITVLGDAVLFYRQGPTHIAFTVHNIDELLKKIIMAGGSCLSQAEHSPDGSVRVAFCRDMENNLLELVEIQQ